MDVVEHTTKSERFAFLIQWAAVTGFARFDVALVERYWMMHSSYRQAG